MDGNSKENVLNTPHTTNSMTEAPQPDLAAMFALNQISFHDLLHFTCPQRRLV